MSRIALITDTHIGVRNNSPIFRENQRKSFRWFFDYLDANNIKHIVHLGDVFDIRKQTATVSATFLREEFIEPILKRDIECHILVGNHDQYYKNTHEVNTVDEVLNQRYPSIHTYSVPSVVLVGGINVQLIPWITDSNYKESMDAIKNPKAEILFGHLELSGFIMQRGAMAENGLSEELFEKFDRVYSGHYHHRSTRGNITYLGAFSEYTWIDYNDPRGFSVLDTETRATTFIQNPHVMFKTIKYDNFAVEEINSFNYQPYKDTYVKLLVVNKDDQYVFDLFFDILDKVGCIDIQIVENPIIVDDNNDEEVEDVQDTPNILDEYISNLTLTVDKSKMKKFMKEVYEQALELE